MFIIACIVCFIIDVSGFVQSMKRLYLRRFWKMKNPDISSLSWKPFDCSLCSTWWSCLLYIIIAGRLTLIYILVAAMLAMISSNISGFMLCIKDFLAAVECRIQKLIEKI